ncbi:cytochrome P450 [Gymnopilus junonius]|uniref:Cytochrome P450 n=1 Tax=Gymnopilus junonius TaxID=109634 RepID=A0A9P5NP82_GYMJU|nr:cytochrome P450 [Gymnopilus junonius]
MSYQQVSVSFLTTIGLYGVYKLAKFIYFQWASPLNVLPGPPSTHFFYGNLKDIWKSENSVLHEKWVEEYGSTLKYKAFFQTSRLYTIDLKAINHILMNSYIYQKPEGARYNLTQILGNGVLVVEEDKHKQQNPAFGAAQIRELTEIFVEKSIQPCLIGKQLRDIWTEESRKANGQVEVLSWLSKMTLDVIGLAGFNYKFNALANEKNELNQAFSTIFRSGTSISVIPIIRSTVPALRFLPAERDAETKLARETMARIGDQLLRESKAEILADEKEHGKVEKLTFKRRDLLSLLLRANMSTDLPPSQRMTDDDVLAQVPTFLVAGHETTSTATSWALFALTQNTEAQMELREELFTIGTDNPTMDELNSLPYLDAVVRETLRIHAPVPMTMRKAVQDDILPLGEPVTDIHGNILDGIKIKKGQTLAIPITTLNRSKAIWGEDAREFKYLSISTGALATCSRTAGGIPGVWGNLMTFLGGPRACIGYRFSLVEMKALLFTLIRAFEFELAVPADEIVKKTTIVQRPIIKSDPEGGNRMPLILKPVNRT